MNPVLTVEEKKWAAKLLRAHGGAAVDLRKYLSKSSLAAAMITTALPPSPSPPSTCFVSNPEGLDPSVCNMKKKAAASLKKVKAEPSSNAPMSPPSYGKKRSLQEANGEEEPLLSLLNTPLSGVRSPPPGFAPKPQNISSRLDRDTTVWEHAREPSDVVATSCAAIPQATNYKPVSLSCALELEEKLLAQERDAAALREQLEESKNELAEAKQEKAKAELASAGAEVAKAKAGLAGAEAEVVKAKAELTAAKRAADAAELGKARPEFAMEGAEVAKAMTKLAAAKRALEEELDSAKVAAVQQLLCCEEHVRRRAGHALEGYQHWRKKRSCCWLVTGEA